MNPLSLRSLQLACSLLVCLLAVFCSSCFIRNCPLGGKRSLNSAVAPIHAQRECLRCGPGGLGQCIGPNICCGNAIGCFMNSAETKVCQHENDIPTPCEIEAPTCGSQQGHCVADGICCTDENCRLDGTCDVKVGDFDLNDQADGYTFTQHTDLTPDLIKYVKRLLAAKASYRRRK